jgi:hypothetical protein
MPNKASLRGSAIKQNSFWVTGSTNSVFVSVDQGKTWQDKSVKVKRITDFRDVEVFDNDISGNGTVNLSIVTYGAETEDENYYPHPKSIQVHGNRFGNGGFDPDIDKAVASILFELSEGNMPDIFWDGVLPLTQMIFGQPDEEKLILADNGDASFLAIRPIKYMLSLPGITSTDIETYNGPIRPLAPVVMDIPQGI